MSGAIRERIVEIIAEQAVLDENEVRMDSTLEELGLDSLAMVEMVFAIEESFDISVPYNANDPAESDFDITTVQSVADGVARLIAEQKPSA
ncbi:acyl carrier protein [Halovulum sp. GXIMD14793]